MWILLSSVVITFEPVLLDLWTCQLFCLSGLTRKMAWPPVTSNGSAGWDRSGLPVVTETIWIGDMALSGVTDPEESGVIAREKAAMVKGDMAWSGLQGLSEDVEPLVFMGGVMDVFWMIVILCLGGAPLVGMTAVLV